MIYKLKDSMPMCKVMETIQNENSDARTQLVVGGYETSLYVIKPGLTVELKISSTVPKTISGSGKDPENEGGLLEWLVERNLVEKKEEE